MAFVSINTTPSIQPVKGKMAHVDTMLIIPYVNGMTPEQFKTWRTTLGWTQLAVADALGVSISTVKRMEKRGTSQLIDLACRQLEGL